VQRLGARLVEGACGNSVFVKVDEAGKPMAVGNDGTYNAWHWLKVPVPQPYELGAGKHQIIVLNREDGIRLDQLLLTGDLEYVPQGIEEE